MRGYLGHHKHDETRQEHVSRVIPKQAIVSTGGVHGQESHTRQAKNRKRKRPIQAFKQMLGALEVIGRLDDDGHNPSIIHAEGGQFQ